MSCCGLRQGAGATTCLSVGQNISRPRIHHSRQLFRYLEPLLDGSTQEPGQTPTPPFLPRTLAANSQQASETEGGKSPAARGIEAYAAGDTWRRHLAVASWWGALVLLVFCLVSSAHASPKSGQLPSPLQEQQGRTQAHKETSMLVVSFESYTGYTTKFL